MYMRKSVSLLPMLVLGLGIALMPSAALAETYDVTIKTGDVPWAGTNSNVWINLYAVRPVSRATVDSGEIQLDNKGANLFTRNSKRTVRITTPSDCPIKDIYGINIRQDDTGKEPDWYIETIELRDVGNGKTKTFLCNGWLNKQNGYQRYLKPFVNF